MIQERSIDYMRVHLSQVGGIAPARRLQQFCVQYGVRICWHGPHRALPDVFSGKPEYGNDGFVYANENTVVSEILSSTFKKRAGPHYMLSLANGYYGGIYYHGLLIDGMIILGTSVFGA